MVLPKFGDKCACGATVVDAKVREDGRVVVLAHWDRGSGSAEWVVWYALDCPDLTAGVQVHSGVYCYTLERAVEVLRIKVEMGKSA